MILHAITYTKTAGGAVILLLNMVRIQLSTAQTLCKQILLMAESLADIANTLELDEVEPPTQLDSVESRENNVVELDICEIQPSTSQMNEAEPPVLVCFLYKIKQKIIELEISIDQKLFILVLFLFV